jgi:hypothetical protein
MSLSLFNVGSPSLNDTKRNQNPLLNMFYSINVLNVISLNLKCKIESFRMVCNRGF